MMVDVRYSVCSSSDGLVARLAVPDSHRVSLDCCLPAEGADVFGVLGDFHLLDLLSQRCTVSVYQKIKLSAMRSNSVSKLVRILRALITPRREEIPNCPLKSILRQSCMLDGINHVPCTVLAGNSDLLGSLRHLG